VPDWIPIQFIDEEIAVGFERPLVLEKKPEAPSTFTLHGETFSIAEVVSTWFDFGRKGRSARNMAPAHLETAGRRGSWGVGRFYFRVRTENGRAFDLYFDRAPENAGDRKGHWYLWREVRLVESPG
jgi:hypothetical protein